MNELPVLGIDAKRYFQYRVNFTAPDQVTSPLFQALTVSSFDTSNPTLELTTSSRTFDTLTGFTELKESDHIGDVKYQISVDGTNWYYHNGTTWVLTTGGFSESNFATQINTNAATIASVIGSGTFHYKAFFNRSPGSGFIKLKGIRVTGTNQH